MKASILDLRYKMSDVLKAIDRNEIVDIHYHGKVKAKLYPYTSEKKQVMKAKDHPLFGMDRKDKMNVEDLMDEIRGGSL